MNPYFACYEFHFLPWTALRACSAALALLVGLAAHTQVLGNPVEDKVERDGHPG